MALSKEAADLLKWLGTEDFSQYGECHGKASLTEAGDAELRGTP